MLGGVFRGVRQRAGVSLGILLVATVAAAAATVGPVYDAAARTSILRDAVDTPVVIDRAVEASISGQVDGLADGLAAQVNGVLTAHLGGPAELRRLFQAPVEDLLVQVQTGGHLEAITWRTGECAPAADRGNVSHRAPPGAGEPLLRRRVPPQAGQHHRHLVLLVPHPHRHRRVRDPAADPAQRRVLAGRPVR